jgi:hypothetical protein
MFRFLFATQAVIGGAIVAGAFVAGAVVGGVLLHEPLRRAAKSMTKSAIRGAEVFGDSWRTIRDEVDDARAEVDAERGARRARAAQASPGNGKESAR